MDRQAPRLRISEISCVIVNDQRRDIAKVLC
jgi:hypothetical protein